MVVMSDAIWTPFASGENLTETGIVSPAAYALCGIVNAYITFPGQVFSASRAGGQLPAASSLARPSAMPERRTNLERLVVLDRVDAEPSRDLDNLAGLPVGAKACPDRDRLELVLDDARPRVGAQARGEVAGDVEREREDVAAGLERVDVRCCLGAGRSGGRRVQKVEVVEEERVVVVVRRRVSPGDLGAAGTAQRRERWPSRALEHGVLTFR